jgi:hypothetical protein
MKKFKVILDFRGAQDGVTVTDFKAGEIVEISDYLAPHISDWAEPYDEDAGESPAPVELARPQIKVKRAAQ